MAAFWPGVGVEMVVVAPAAVGVTAVLVSTGKYVAMVEVS
jgi:hypothetical protein